MEINVLTTFEYSPETGEVTNHNIETYTCTTSIQLQDIICIKIYFVKQGHSRSIYAGYALRTIFDKRNLFYVNNGKNSQYVYLLGDDTKYNILRATNARTLETSFPYRLIRQVYNVSAQDLRFIQPEPDTNVNSITRNLKYTFGIEFETSGGVVPEDKCFRYGLVPLRDGSITGIEYATVPLTHKHINTLKQQIQCLKKYTTFNDTCSMHIHFGKLPADLKFFYILYRVFSVIEDEFEAILPAYTFHTELYKKNYKSYCGKIPKDLKIDEWYNSLACTEHLLDVNATTTNLKLRHPCDPDGTHKWNIPTRYFSLNFINALFYNRNKTVEFRFLKPTYNINYIINWLYILTAIIKFSEKLYIQYNFKQMTFKECNDTLDKIPDCFSLSNCIYTVFNTNTIIDVLFDFLDKLRVVTKLQQYVGDNIGLKTEFHDLYFKRNPIDQ